MNIDAFLLLTDIEKEEIIWEDGIFIATYDEDGTLYDVYHLYEFYVAFTYSLPRNEVTGITAQVNRKDLPIQALVHNLQ